MRSVLLACLIALVPLHADADDKLKDAPSVAESIAKFCKVDAATETTLDTFDEHRQPACAADAACKAAANALCAKWKGTRVPAPAPAAGVVAASWQAALVTGIGNTIADRAKAEVQAWFERLIRDELCKLKTGNVRWFDATCKLVDDDDHGAGQQLASSLVAETMKRDLENLLSLVAGYLKTKVSKPALVSVIVAGAAIAVVVHHAVTGKSPLVLVRDLARNADIKQECIGRADKKAMTPACALVFGGMAIDYYGAVLQDAMKTNGALDLAKLRQLVEKVFAAGELQCEVTKAMTGAAACDAAAMQDTPDFVAKFFTVAAATDAATLDKLFAVFEDMVAIDDLLEAPPPTSPEQTRTRVRQVLEKLESLVDHIEKLCWDQPPAEAKALRGFLTAAIAIANREYRIAALALVEIARGVETSLPEWAARLLPLIVDLAEAQSSEEVSAAMTRAAAPIGSWRLKRQKPLTSITALVGGAVGYETPYGDNKMSTQELEPGVAAGLMAPVGIQFSVPCVPLACDKGWSTGLLISVLDLGQITWSRLEEETKTADEAGAEATPDASLSKVFSPGAYLVIGAGHTPLTFGVGASFAPELRAYTIDVSGTEVTTETTVVRFGAFLAIDVTLFPF